MSPAVLTETIWALAHEEEPIIPDRVIALTTTRGRERLISDLLEPCDPLYGASIWDELRTALGNRGHELEGKLRFGASGDNIKVFTAYDQDLNRNVELDDIRSVEHNNAVGDFVLESIRAIVENPDTHLIISVAGGRKTVGVLIYGCMMLVGREDDRVVHVLVNSPFDDARLHPPFFFPTQSRSTLSSPGGDVTAVDAKIELADVPFVPLRNGFLREAGKLPGRFSAMVDACREAVNRNSARDLEFSICQSRKVIAVGGNEIELGPREHLVMLFLALRKRACEPPIGSYTEAEPLLETFRSQLRESVTEDSFTSWKHNIGSPLEAREITHAISEIRAKLRRYGGAGHALINCLPVRGRFSLDIPPDQIHIAD